MSAKQIGWTVLIVVATVVGLNIIKPNLPAGVRRLFD